MREKKESDNSIEYASFSSRILAHLVDSGLVVVVFFFVFGLAAIFIGAVGAGDSAELNLLLNIFLLSIWPLYMGGFESSPWQATPGKRLLKIVVTDENGERLSFIRATVRGTLMNVLWLVTFGIGIISAMIHKRSQCLHDIFAGCLVLKRNENLGNAKSKPAEVNNNLTDQHVNLVYAQIAKELAEGRVDAGLWSRAEVESNGAADRTRVIYTRLRFDSIRRSILNKRIEAGIPSKVSDKGIELPENVKQWRPFLISLFFVMTPFWGIFLAIFLPAFNNQIAKEKYTPMVLALEDPKVYFAVCVQDGDCTTQTSWNMDFFSATPILFPKKESEIVSISREGEAGVNPGWVAEKVSDDEFWVVGTPKSVKGTSITPSDTIVLIVKREGNSAKFYIHNRSGCKMHKGGAIC